MHCDALAVTSDEILAVPNERQSRFGGIRELGIPGSQIKRGRLHEMNHNIQGVSKKRYFSDCRLISVLEVGFCFFTCVLES